jgi:hypothetical protein
MKDDPAIEQTRDVRRRISASVADDPARMVDYYIEMQKRLIVRLRPGPADAYESASEPRLRAATRKDARG